MNYELVGVLGAVGGIVVLALLYVRAAAKAAQATNLELINTNLVASMRTTREIAANKEEYIRELEKAIIGSLPAGKLVERLNRMFAANRSRKASAVQAAGRSPKAS
jgi:hypothetical protein